MSIHLFYALNLLLLLSSLLLLRLKTAERRLSLSLVQALLYSPLLAGEYIYLYYHLEPQSVPLILFSESAFAVLWFYAAHRLCRVTVATDPESNLSCSIQILAGAAAIGLGAYCLVRQPDIRIADEILCFEPYGLVHLCALFLLLSVLAAAWRLEEFWRTLAPVRRWEYKFLVVGGYLVCGALGWATSYRLTYLRLVPDHFFLLAVLLLFAWFLMCYAVARHRLLNRKMFVSRKVVYSFVAPTIFAGYLFALGLVSVVMRTFGLPLPFVLQWLFLTLGLVALGLFACSGKLRRRVQFFISTHFYI
jgi:hypothetical protein